MDMNYFRAIQGSLNSPTKTETRRRKAIHSISKDFNKALSVENFIRWEMGEITNCTVPLNIDKREFSTVIGHKMEFTCLIDTCIDVGTIIYNPDEETYWLTIYMSKVDRLHKKGILYRCNWELRWKDANEIIWTYPACDINSTQYNSGIDQGRNVDYVTSQHKLTTTSDINTNSLLIDKRFFLGKNVAVPDVYRLTQNDSSSQNYGQGLVSLTLLRDVYNEKTDDAVLRICDVYPQSEKQLSNGLELSFISPATVRIGSKKTVSAISAEPIVSWQVEESDISDYIQLVPKDDYKCVISIPIKKDVISLNGNQFTLRFATESGVSGLQTFTMVIGGG